MAMNSKLIDKYEKAYSNLQPMMRRPIEIISTNEIYEEWRDISSIYAIGVMDNSYRISSFGRVYSKLTNTYLNPYMNPKGYLTITLRAQHMNHIVFKVHRLVMLHFKFRPDCYLLEIDHKNNDKTDNHIWNLEWVTPQENIHRAINTGMRPLSCTIDNGILLSDDEAHKLFQEIYEYYSINMNLDIDHIAEKYGVKTQYAIDLFRGSIRPYIAKTYYIKFHYEEEEARRKEYYNIQ